MTNINPDRSERRAPTARGRRPSGRTRARPSDPRYWKRSVAVAAVASCFATGVALANPVGPTVVAGQASFSEQGSQLTVTNSANAIIHWQGFSIGPAELTRFIQPSASSAVLNRVVGGIPSDILGALQSNGRVFLINPSGIVFGAGARIDVAGLVASTLNITNEDFLSGRLRFAETPGAGSVINQGVIRTAPRGNVYLIAPNVENSGVITSPQGEIILAAGRSVELVDVGTPDLRVQITAPEGEAVNLGSIVAESGRIGIYAGLIQQKGAVNADTVVVGEGGRITFKAKDLTLAPGSVTTASGAPGGVHDGGEVRIVADGTLNMEAGAEVHVDGGADGGSGGFLELSGKQLLLNRDYSVRARNPGYRGGSLLIDPTDIEFCVSLDCVVAGATPIDPATINVSGAATVSFAASNNIAVSSPISAADLRGGSPGAGIELGLTATNNVAFNANIDFAPDQRLFVEAGNNIVTGNNAVVRAGEINFDATGGGITIGANTSVVASNPAFAHVGLLAGTVTDSDFASAPANSVDILGTVAALGQGTNLVTIGGSRVTVADSGNVLAATGGSPTASQASVLIAAMGTATGGFGQPGFLPPSQINFGAGNTVHISGPVAASDPNSANVFVSGGTVTLGAGARLDAAGGFAFVEAAAAKSTTEVVGATTVNTATFETGNLVQVAAGATLNALGTQIAEVNLIGGSVSVAGIAQASGHSGALVAVVAASQFTETSPIEGPGQTVEFAHGAGHDVTVSGRAQAGAAAGNAQVTLAGDRVSVTGGTVVTPNIVVSGSSPFGGVLAVAAQNSTFSGTGGSTLVASTHDASRNVVGISGWIAGAAGDITVDLVGGSVNVNPGAGVVATGVTSRAEVAVVAVGNLASTLGSPFTFQATQGAGNRATIGGIVAASGNSGVVSVLGGSVDVQGTGIVVAEGANSRVALAAGGTADFTADPIVRLTALTATGTNAVSVSGQVAAEQEVDIIGGVVTVGVGGGVFALGSVDAAIINLVALNSLTTDLAGNATTTHDPGNLAQVNGVLAADGASGVGKVSVVGGSVQVGGIVSTDGLNEAGIGILAAGQASFAPGFVGTGFAATTANTVGISGSLNTGLDGPLASGIGVLGGQVSFTGFAESRSDAASIFIAATSAPCSGTACPSTPGMQVNLSGTVMATGLNTANVGVAGDSINQSGGTLAATGNAGAEVALETATGPLNVGGIVSAEGGTAGEGIVGLLAKAGSIVVSGSVTATGALASQIGARVGISASSGTVTVASGATVRASNTATSGGAASVSIFGSDGAVLDGTVEARATSSGGSSSVDVFTEINDISVGAPATVTATAPVFAEVFFGAGGGLTVAGHVAAGDPLAPGGSARVFMTGDSLTVLAGGEVEATATTGGLVVGSASGDITIGGNIYGGFAGGGVTLEAGGAIIGAGGTIDGGVGDAINLTAANGIGAVGAPVRILDGEATVSASNSTSGDLVLSQVNGDLFFGPASGGGFTSVSNAGGGGIDLVSQTGNALVQAPLSGGNSFLRVAAAGGVTVSSSVQNTLGSVFLQGAGGVSIGGPLAGVFAQQDVGINGGPVNVVNGSSVVANRNLVIAGSGITVRNGFLTAGSNMGLTSLGNLTVEDSNVVGGNGTGLFTATVVGDFIIRGVSGLSKVRYFPDIGSPTLPVTIFGSLQFEGTEAAPAVLESVSAASVYLFFPLLGSGGVFVNGVEQTSSGLSGIFADGAPAVLGTNLFITYGSSNVPDLITPLTGYINQAAQFAVPAGEQGGQQPIGSEEEDERKKKRPRNCS
jgi:filamentous hemagglutinin family protein